MLTPKLDRSVVVAKDLKKQPDSKYILIVGDGDSGHVNYYAVDNYEIEADAVAIFWLANQPDPVYICRKDGQWTLIRRDSCGVVTERELIQFSKKDNDEQMAFMKDLDPEGMKRAEERARQGLAGLPMVFLGGEEDEHPQAGKRPKRSAEEGAALEERLNRQYL